MNTAYYWHNTDKQDIKWNQSDLYKGLNGVAGGTYTNLFIGNTEYMPSGWSDKIETVNWKYGDLNNKNQVPATILQTEQAWTTTVSAKIGLMYMADYYFAYQKEGLNCSSSGSTCRTSWMHMSQSDTTAPSNGEWSMSRNGYSNMNSCYYAGFVHETGYATENKFFYPLLVRPVFYLTSNTKIKSGTGTINDPYIIK